jgi:hypothetical protein
MSGGDKTVTDLKNQLKARDQEFCALKASFDDYVESSKELELELEGALEDVSSVQQNKYLCRTMQFCIRAHPFFVNIHTYILNVFCVPAM